MSIITNKLYKKSSQNSNIYNRYRVNFMSKHRKHSKINAFSVFACYGQPLVFLQKRTKVHLRLVNSKALEFNTLEPLFLDLLNHLQL